MEKKQDADGWVAIDSIEDLPKCDGSYWVATKDGNVHLGHLNADKTDFRRKGVIAWMPYPKTPAPYRRQSEGE